MLQGSASCGWVRINVKGVGEQPTIERSNMTKKAGAILQWLANLPYQVGQRGVLLLVFSFVGLAYGIGLVSGYEPTFSTALGLSSVGFGIIFITIGVILLLGALLRWGRFPYALGASLSFFWAFILTGFWALPFGWVASISWLGMGLVQLVCVLWPEPVTGDRPTKVKAYKQTLYLITSSELVDDDSEDDRPDEVPK
jgi:hypothetical protein